jgi:hypothetical protein
MALQDGPSVPEVIKSDAVGQVAANLKPLRGKRFIQHGLGSTPPQQLLIRMLPGCFPRQLTPGLIAALAQEN